MTEENHIELSSNKQALLKIRQLQRQIDELVQRQQVAFEPIAIVSMACRFPRRSTTPEAFWQSLIDRTNEITEIPQARWNLSAFYDENPDVPGHMYARHGAFLDDLDLMDPEFFGISPREATWIDPQQRLLMEVGWEAFERAGWRPSRVGERTGIFVGWMHNDYQNEASDSFLNLNPYIATGAAGSFLCGRLAYSLGLQGPSVAIDTACSSSLVALHLACQSIQQGDCDRALVGGVNAICSPTTNILTCKLKALSPNGHSRAFDAAADGYVRGEGCGVVTLRGLKDAERDGDPILGVIRGSAIGHNGVGSGLTVPNPKAQQRVIEQALHRAGVSPSEVAYLEAHGTGTELGDPIEMQAAAAVLAAGRDKNHPLFVGSVKTNIGHLEAAAGMAGLLKVLLSIQNEQIPGQLNFDQPNPHIAWDKIAVKVLTEATEWPDAKKQIAGVSAFGMSGTNAHVIVEATRSTSRSSTRRVSSNVSEENSPQLVVLSGKSEEALNALANRFEEVLRSDPSWSMADVAFTSATCREHFHQRAAVVVRNHDEVRDVLRDMRRGSPSNAWCRANGRRPLKTAWQFTGQGSQYVGMARGLYESEPLFRQSIDHCSELLEHRRGESLTGILFESDGRLDQTSWTQPAIFAVQMGIARLLDAYGLRPGVVLGHSVGQYAAACVAGVMSWDDGFRLISERGRLIGELPTGGKMLAVFAPLQEVEQEVEQDDCSAALSIAAWNGTHVVLSGDASAISKIESRFAARNIRCKALPTSHAFHSALMDPVLEAFRDVVDQIPLQPPQLPLICNVTGEVVAADRVLDGAYWAQHIREAVRYSTSVETAQELGCELLLEVGPQSVLTHMAAANWRSSNDLLVSCLERNADDAASLLGVIGKLYVHGVTPDFDAMYTGRSGRRVNLPTYPFQRRRFWGPDKPCAAHADYHTAHPLLGNKISLAGTTNEIRYESYLECDSPSWLSDHEVMGHVVVPAAAYVEMAVEVAAGHCIDNVKFDRPLQPTSRTKVQSVLRTQQDGSKSIEVFSASADGCHWTRHFSGQITGRSPDAPGAIDVAEVEESCGEAVDRDEFYRKMHEIGLNYGLEFQTISSLRLSRESVFARLSTNSDVRGFTIPPMLLDGALHSLAAGLVAEDDGELYLPVEIGRVQCFCPTSEEVVCHASWRGDEGKTRTADLMLCTAAGEVIARIDGLKVQQINREVLSKISGAGPRSLVYQLDWQSFRLPPRTASEKTWLLIDGGGSHPRRTHLTDRLTSDGNQVISVSLQDGTEFTEQSPTALTIDGSSQDQWSQTLKQFSTLTPNGIPAGIIWLFDHAQDSLAQQDQHIVSTRTNCEGLLNLIQSLQTQDFRQLECGLVLVTTNGVSVGEESLCDPCQSQYWGLGRVIGAEQPGYRSRLIDVDAAEIEDDATTIAVVDVLLTETRESQLVIRDAEYLVPRLQSIARPQSAEARVAIDPAASYLITGGLGMLGRHAAKWLVDLGAAQVVLVSRRTPDDDTRAFLDGLAEDGCQIVIHHADISSHSDVEALFARFSADLLPLKGVIHAAGIVDDALIDRQNWERFEHVLAPKITGARLLDQFTRSLPLDFFVLYSSAASVLGSPGQSNYATGNAFQDGLAWERRRAGLPATSINWGPWSEGMANDERIVKRLALQGISPLSVPEAHRAMADILVAGLVQATVMDADWNRMSRGLGGEAPTLLESLLPKRASTPAADSAFVGQLKTLRGSVRRDLLAKTIQESLQRILATPEVPDLDRPLIEIGLDSLMAVEFSTELQTMLGDQFLVGPAMLFDHPSVAAITEHILDSLKSETSNTAPVVQAPVVPQAAARLRKREPIAIVGLSCRFPGAHDAEEFWDNMLNGIDSVREIPSDRWDVDRFYDANREPGKMYCREGGFLEDIADFDAAFFNISDQEACWIDPQHRLLLENSYLALEDAGISTSPLSDANVGVFMGIMGQDYAFLPRLEDEHIIQTFQGAGLSHSAGVGRISYVFGFEGPSLAIDTASSSSLVAVYQAMRSLQDGNCNMALAGGVNAILAPVNSLLMSKAGLLSPDGRCKSFSAQADGFGRGEGCGVVVLKRLSDADRDGDRILAVIRGGAVMHNGFTGGITSPSGKAQARVIGEALQDAGVAPSQVQYLEAHGTGTELGDPMELSAAASVYGRGRTPENPFLVGSVKANISHLEAAGGISGLIKTVLSLQHGLIPPQANFDKPSRHVPWKRLPIKIVTEPTLWPDTDERIAGVTALGLVGTNAHVIVSGVTQSASSAGANQEKSESVAVAAASSNLLVLSARSDQALDDLAGRYRQFMSDHPQVDVSQVCRAAATGRRHFEHRLALTIDSSEEMIKKLPAAGFVQADCGVSRGLASSQPRMAWVFANQDSRQLDLARELYAAEPVFREMLSRFDERLRVHLEQTQQSLWSLVDSMAPKHTGSNGHEPLGGGVLQFIFQSGLAHVWRSWGVEPDVVLGLGIGQYVAACSAGVLSFEDALTLVVEREKAVGKISSHDEQREAALGQFEAFADGLNFYPPNLQLICSLTGTVVPLNRSLGGSYWREHVTAEPSRLSSSTLADTDPDYTFHFGTHGSHEGPCLIDRDVGSSELPKCIAKARSLRSRMLETLGRLYVGGVNPAFEAITPNCKRTHVELPKYPFQKKRYWITELDRHTQETAPQPVALR